MLRIFWSSLPKTLVRVIGRYESGCEGSFEGLRMAKIIANFHDGGYELWRRMDLNKERRYEREFGWRFLSMEA